MKDFKGVFDYGLASKNEREIIYFLDKIYKISVDNSKIWEKEIANFFSEKLFVPYIVQSYIDESLYDGLIEDAKRLFFDNIITHKVVIIDTSDIFKELMKIRESLKVGANLKKYLPYLFFLNFTFRRMYIKVVDSEDSFFNDMKVGIRPFHYELTYDGQKEPVFETILFILPDSSLDYPFDDWHREISKKWKEQLKSKLFNKKKASVSKRNPLDSRLRHECFKRDGYKCKECGASNKESVLHCDHIIPVAQGGTDELENLQTLCDKCNLAKSDKKWIGGVK